MNTNQINYKRIYKKFKDQWEIDFSNTPKREVTFYRVYLIICLANKNNILPVMIKMIFDNSKTCRSFCVKLQKSLFGLTKTSKIFDNFIKCYLDHLYNIEWSNNILKQIIALTSVSNYFSIHFFKKIFFTYDSTTSVLEEITPLIKKISDLKYIIDFHSDINNPWFIFLLKYHLWDFLHKYKSNMKAIKILFFFKIKHSYHFSEKKLLSLSFYSPIDNCIYKAIDDFSLAWKKLNLDEYYDATSMDEAQFRIILLLTFPTEITMDTLRIPKMIKKKVYKKPMENAIWDFKIINT